MMLSSLFGAGCLGLRALATGIPASILLNPRRALAGPCGTGAAPQFVIFQTAGSGDPINANAPGSYFPSVNNLPGVLNCPEANLPTATTTLGGQSYKAAAGWAQMPAASTSIWHIMTDTPIHPHEPNVLGLNAAMVQPDMFPSWLARQLQPCLGSVQAQPICIGAATPSEALTYQGAALPIIPPRALQATLTNSGVLSTSTLQALRDSTLAKLNNVYLKDATRAQTNFVNSMVISQKQVREIPQALLANLNGITDNTADSQVTAAVCLIQMNISPVISIHIPFGGDNHNDNNLMTEATQTAAGLATMQKLMTLLQTSYMPNNTTTPLSKLVSLVSLNVFGRTLAAVTDATYGNQTTANGRQHNPNHQVSFAIGAPFKGGVYGGLQILTKEEGSDFGCLPISSETGAGSASGDIKPVDTLAAFAMTVATGVGIPESVVTGAISSESNYTPSGLGTAKIVSAALA
jgi:hypothetical protein